MSVTGEVVPAPAQVPAVRSCIACEETPGDDELVKPCRICLWDYCKDCLMEMFRGATTGASPMPPRCCTPLQIHTAYLDDETATRYRERFEEYVTRDKTYCPSRTCSAFIPERLLPAVETPPTLQSLQLEILESIVQSANSRFFRGELPITEQPGYTTIVPQYMDLGIIRERITAGVYKTFRDEIITDLQLIVSNARRYNGSTHPVAKTANLFTDTFTRAFAGVGDKLLPLLAGLRYQKHFLCPKCHIGICVECKQIAHDDVPCDTTAQDHELAMLEQFEYKRCPLCKHAVKKMYGCSHMHEDEDNEMVDDEHDEADLEEPAENKLQDYLGVDAVDANHGDTPKTQTAGLVIDTTTSVQPLPPNPEGRLVDLDAGGTRRWLDGEMDFGEEPEEDGGEQIWACRHRFRSYKLHGSRMSFNCGDLSKMECNSCFCRVRPDVEVVVKAKKKSHRFSQFSTARVVHEAYLRDAAKNESAFPMAMECTYCFFVLCEACCGKAKAKAKALVTS
ncbi:hypothetical protein LTR62_007886 [Meristemomyces frigidus]|uniref:Bromo domain-containing protein n=1 Tax=Meristemomyces frigidus TaxID=1508187 RepID=A0AAN7YD23_9PEZI|nr:hypothetical protein LTR62_007886 [Meristemomyces frigidus]